uniref:hypothetical protein n=1 Tax=Candidatus Limisoma sp. TaxID=3076476 RepID=UPI003FEE7497
EKDAQNPGTHPLRSAYRVGKVPSLRDDTDVAMAFLQPLFGDFPLWMCRGVEVGTSMPHAPFAHRSD